MNILDNKLHLMHYSDYCYMSIIDDEEEKKEIHGVVDLSLCLSATPLWWVSDNIDRSSTSCSSEQMFLLNSSGSSPVSPAGWLITHPPSPSDKPHSHTIIRTRTRAHPGTPIHNKHPSSPFTPYSTTNTAMGSMTSHRDPLCKTLSLIPFGECLE